MMKKENLLLRSQIIDKVKRVVIKNRNWYFEQVTGKKD